MKHISICGRIRRLKYPATPEGKRKFIQDSLDDTWQTYRRKEIRSLILIVVTCIGLIVLLLFLL